MYTISMDFLIAIRSSMFCGWGFVFFVLALQPVHWVEHDLITVCREAFLASNEVVDGGRMRGGTGDCSFGYGVYLCVDEHSGDIIFDVEAQLSQGNEYALAELVSLMIKCAWLVMASLSIYGLNCEPAGWF